MAKRADNYNDMELAIASTKPFYHRSNKGPWRNRGLITDNHYKVHSRIFHRGVPLDPLLQLDIDLIKNKVTFVNKTYYSEAIMRVQHIIRKYYKKS